MPCHCGICVWDERDIHTYVVWIATQVACTVLRSCLLFPYPLPLTQSSILKAKDWGRAKDRKSSCFLTSPLYRFGSGSCAVLGPHTYVCEPSSNNRSLNTSYKDPLFTTGEKARLHFPGGHGSYRLLLCLRASWVSSTLLLCYANTTGVVLVLFSLLLPLTPPVLWIKIQFPETLNN